MTPTANLEWHPASVAATWPEGSVVMYAAWENGGPCWADAAIKTHHQPHWCREDFHQHFWRTRMWVLLKRKDATS